MGKTPSNRALYTPAKIGTMELKNRWIMLAMHTGYAQKDGGFSKRDYAFYRERASGGMAAITLVGAVNEEGEQERMHRLDRPDLAEGLKKVCNIIHEADTKVIVQLFHAGRNKRITDEQPIMPVAPFAVPSPIYRTMPRVMSEDEIQRTIVDFANAAKHCRDCGADAVEVSVSAGYLLSQFLSPLVNQRTDAWGGDSDARMRFPTAVLIAIREAVGKQYPILIKISGGDMLGGYDLQYMADFINQLPAGTVDGVTVTGGWHEAPVPQISYHVKPGAFSYLARQIREKTGLPVIACNRIHTEDVAEQILEAGDADFVGAARPFLTDPQFINKMQSSKPYYPCQACNKGCIERVLKGEDVACAFNPEAGREYLIKKPRTVDRNLLVGGAGPVGLMAAVYAARSGNRVTVMTRDPEIGGRLNLACKPPFKQGLKKFTEAAAAELRELGVVIETNAPVTKDSILARHVDEVFLAFGAEPIRLKLAGVEKLKAYTADEVLNNPKIELGKKVIVAGGGSVGLETAEYLATKCNPDGDRNVTVVEMEEKAGKDLGGIKWIMMTALKDLQVSVLTSTKLLCCTQEGVAVEKEGKETCLPADTLIFAVGAKPRHDLELETWLQEKKIPYHIIGDAQKPSNVMNGLAELYRTFYQLEKG